ncbi:MAG: S8 family serine peptidase [Bacteroidales bacterium]|nr:S8 family serine peptidase [Bacteroidales bacterium]
MKKVILLTVLLISVAVVYAQGTALSPRAVILLNQVKECKSTQVTTDMGSAFMKVKNDDEAYVHAFVSLSQDVDTGILTNYGIKPCSVAGGIMTVLIPVSHLAQFAASGVCSYIDIEQKMTLFLDRVRSELGVDYIHQGINLPQGYDGTGVVVGIIDLGFEYGHPSFYDSTGTTLRVKRVWNQEDSRGTPPAGYAYGTEYATQEQILAAGTDTDITGHGTHVAGIAAGCGAPDGEGRRYCGIAPGADIVLVAVNRISTTFDAIRYIHEYARSVGKPCVINMSYGSINNPHDGTDPFDRMIEDYLRTNPADSIVLVSAAGNSGVRTQHLHKHFNPTDTIVKSLLSNLEYQESYNSEIVCWGSAGDLFSVSMVLHYNYGGENPFTPVAETPFISSDVDSVYTFQLVSPQGRIYTVTIAVSHWNPFNSRPSIIVDISAPYLSDHISLTIKSTDADVHVWCQSDDFISYRDTDFTRGDSYYTIAGMGGNSDAVISVGSYATRVSGIQDYSHSEGELSMFSSLGPTLDGRTKPDICAPGEKVFSGDNSYSVLNSSYIVDVDSAIYNGQYHYYGLKQGTSMSSPAVAGVIALWLQHNPSLNVDSARTLIHNTAFTDSFTGDIPDTGSCSWGWGKINAFAGLPPTAVPMFKLRVATADYTGRVSGGGYHPMGNRTIEAFPPVGFAFKQWNDGNTDNPRVVNLTSDTMFVVEFELSGCDTINTFPWYAVFDDEELRCWDIFSNIGGNYLGWVYLSGVMSSLAHSMVDAWLVSPHVDVESGTSLFYYCTSSNVTAFDSLAVVAITSDGDTIVLADEPYSVTVGGQRAVNLSPIAGQVVRIGFHHHYCGGATSILKLENVIIDYDLGIAPSESSPIGVYVENGKLHIFGAEGLLQVFDIMGRQLGAVRVDGQATINSHVLGITHPGIYLLRIGENSRKVVIDILK